MEKYQHVFDSFIQFETQYDGYLLEGMACPGGCIAGVGTVQPLAKSVAAVNLHKKVSTNQHSHQSDYQDELKELEEDLFDSHKN